MGAGKSVFTLIVRQYSRLAYLWFGARINHRIAAPTKNRAPMTRLSPGLAISVRKNNPPMKPGEDQQTPPATAKTIASALIIVATPSPQRQSDNHVYRLSLSET
jgi:hypothetical protein